eukprot:1859411-Rhodomonas_salina.1
MKQLLLSSDSGWHQSEGAQAWERSVEGERVEDHGVWWKRVVCGRLSLRLWREEAAFMLRPNSCTLRAGSG